MTSKPNLMRPQLILPGEFSEAGLMRVRGHAPRLGISRDVANQLFEPPKLLVVGEAPSFFDQLGSYATHQELTELLFDKEFRELGLVTQPTLETLIKIIEQVPFEPAMRFLGALHKRIWYLGRLGNDDGQRQLLHELFGTGEVTDAAEKLLRAGRTLFTEQQAYALMRLVVLHADSRSADGLMPDEQARLKTALLFVPGIVLQAATGEYAEDAANGDHDAWMRYFVGTGGLVGGGHIKFEMPRAHRMYEVIAKSPAARRHDDYCMLDAWFKERYQLSFVELQAFGFTIYCGSQVGDANHEPLAVRPDYFASTALAGRVDAGLEAVSADRDWYRARFAGTKETERSAAFEIYPFLMKPCLRQPDGTALVLSPRGIESWLGTSGSYYRLLDIARDKKMFDQFGRFNGFLHERYARHLLHEAYPRVPSSTLVTRQVIPEIKYLIGKQEMKTNDVTVDLGLDLVLFEVTAKRVTSRSLVEADADTIAKDLQALVIDKMKQLGRVIEHVFAGHAELPGVDLKFVKNVWPVIVNADGVFQNPSLWEYIHREGGHHLDLRVPATIKPLLVTDLEELEILAGIVQEGGSLTAVLERVTQPGWIERGLKAWHHGDAAGRIGTGDSPFVRREFFSSAQAIKRAIALRPGGFDQDMVRGRVDGRQAA